MASLLGKGGAGVVANSAQSRATAIILYERQAGSPEVVVDGGNFAEYNVCNTGTTDGTTASTDWLYVQLSQLHETVGIITDTHAMPLLPGESMSFKISQKGNGITRIRAWTRAAGGGSAAAGNVMVKGGGQGQN